MFVIICISTDDLKPQVSQQHLKMILVSERISLSKQMLRVN
jgi:hypothetical protein